MAGDFELKAKLRNKNKCFIILINLKLRNVQAMWKRLASTGRSGTGENPKVMAAKLVRQGA